MEFDIDAEENDLWRKLIKGLKRSNKWQFGIKIFLILGGTLVSVIGGAMEGPLSPTAGDGVLTQKGMMVILGACAAGFGGFLLLFMEWETPELLDNAKRYIRQVRIYFNERDALLRLDDKRRALLDMQKNIFEACEQIEIKENIDNVAEVILTVGSVNLNAAIGFEAGEAWAFSIFKKVGPGADECMQRIAVHWADRGGEKRDGRSWKKKEGFTGWAWHDGAEVIVEDVNAPEWHGKFSAPQGKRHENDPVRYVSAAAVPIRLGGANEIWGIVTATSNVAGRFKRNPHDVRSQNVDTVRVLARLLATQVALRRQAA